MRRWADLPVPPRPAGSEGPRWRRALTGGLPPLIAAALLLALGHAVLAAVLLVVAAVLTVASAQSPRFAAAVARALAAVGRAAAAFVSAVLLGLAQVLLVLPVAAVGALLRRDPLHIRPVGGGSQWSSGRRPLPARRPFGPDQRVAAERGPAVRALATVPRLVGVVGVLALLNYGLGWLWDEYAGSHDVPVASGAQVAPEDLAETSAMADEEWAAAYWDEYAELDFDFRPFVMTRVADVEGQHITSLDGVRATLAPDDEQAPEIWLFGGAAAWGQGQRDAHTVASALVRRAEAAGEPVRILNLGQPGYTSWQSALLFEQQLAVRPAPVLALFYEGADDVAVQLEDRTEGPSHYNAPGARVVLTGRDSASEQAWELWEDYRETGLLTRALDRVAGIFGVAPAAADTDDDLARHVADLRRRSIDFAGMAGDLYDVPVLAVSQAATGVPGDGGAYRESARQLTEAEDLSAVLDDVADEVFVDGVLTDEDGARLVAEALWPLVATRID